jgi:hypothetical protein
VTDERKWGRMLATVGEDMEVWEVEIASLREQDVNPQVMKPREFDRLTENIRTRGELESLPYCYLPRDGDGPMEVVSGHHRSRGARAAGKDRIVVLVDRKPMTRSELAAKQIAHNELHGNPDLAILRELLTVVTDADDLLATGLPEELLPTPAAEPTTLSIPHADFDWRTVTFTFLPHQLAAFKEVIDAIEGSTDLVGVAPIECYEDFARALASFSRIKEIRAIGTGVYELTKVARREVLAIEEAEADHADVDAWVPLSDALGSPRIPAAVSDVVKRAVAKAREAGEIGERNAWQLLEWWAADYLGGS